MNLNSKLLVKIWKENAINFPSCLAVMDQKLGVPNDELSLLYEQSKYACKVCTVYGLNRGFGDEKHARDTIEALGEVLNEILYNQQMIVDKKNKVKKYQKDVAKILDKYDWQPICRLPDLTEVLNASSMGLSALFRTYVNDTILCMGALAREIEGMGEEDFAILREQAGLPVDTSLDDWKKDNRYALSAIANALKGLVSKSCDVLDDASEAAARKVKSICNIIAKWRVQVVYSYLTFNASHLVLLQEADAKLDEWIARTVGVSPSNTRQTEDLVVSTQDELGAYVKRYEKAR